MTKSGNEKFSAGHRANLSEARRRQYPQPHPKGSTVSPEGRKNMSEAQRLVRNTEEKDAKIVEALKNGWSWKWMTRRLGVNHARIHRVADENDLPTPPTNVRSDPKYHQAVVEAHNAGLSQKEIAEQLGIGRVTVRNIQTEKGLFVRRGRRPGSTRRTTN